MLSSKGGSGGTERFLRNRAFLQYRAQQGEECQLFQVFQLFHVSGIARPLPLDAWGKTIYALCQSALSRVA
jgi:hypothetical protein